MRKPNLHWLEWMLGLKATKIGTARGSESSLLSDLLGSGFGFGLRLAKGLGLRV